MAYSNSARIIALWFAFSMVLGAQQTRFNGPIASRRIVALQNHVDRRALPRDDLGAVDPAMPLPGMSLLLQRTPAQQAALEKLLAEQQDPSSPRYRKFLEPEDYADRFGYASADLAKIQEWLEAQGLIVDNIPRSRNWITFSGSAAKVESAFQTRLHRFAGHFANTANPSLPSDLAAHALAIHGLNDFPDAMPLAHEIPQFTNGNSHTLYPGDLATVYNTNPLLDAGFDGTGQKIAIVGRCNITVADIATFRASVGLPGNPLETVLPTGSANPGNKSAGDCNEAYLDIETAGGVAPGAGIYFVYSNSILTDLQWIVANKSAPVISMSYGSCETQGGNHFFYQALAQQANSLGITWLTSSGDSGAADCDAQASAATAKLGLSVGEYPAIPEITGVGGTQFDESGGTYWSTTNAANFSSALSYIPEIAWNESSANGLGSTGGGLSTIFPKPAWQVGPGVPADNARAVPDISLASSGRNGYRVYYGGATHVFGGTSASAPALAGIFAILNQYWIGRGFTTFGQGNVNPQLYRLAASNPEAFHDVTGGNNVVLCATGTRDCPESGSYGYAAGPGYDMATGLGSVDANALVLAWGNRLSNSTVTISASPSSLPVGGATTLTIAATGAGTAATPTGKITLTSGAKYLGTANLVDGAAAYSLVTSQLSPSVGSYDVTATYEGDGNFNTGMASASVSVTPADGDSNPLLSVGPNPIYQRAPDANGNAFIYTIRITELAGVPTTLKTLRVGGTDLSSSLISYFRTTSLPPFGSFSVTLGASGIAVPDSRDVAMSGVDANGRIWMRNATLNFVGAPTGAVMTLASYPGVVRRNAGAACPFSAQLVLEETSGKNVQLNTLTIAGADVSSSAATLFGATTLPAFGSLAGNYCASDINPPQTLALEVNGIDDSGLAVSAAVTVAYDAAATGSSLLAITKPTITASVTSATQAVSTFLPIVVAPGQPWTATVSPAGATAWLKLGAVAGNGSATVNVALYGTPPGGTALSGGPHRATIYVQSLNSVPQAVAVPVNFSLPVTLSPEPSGTTVLTVNPALECPGYYTAVIGLRPGARDGVWGTRISLNSAGRYLQGGINLGGGFAANGGHPGFAAFTIANPAVEPQTLTIDLTAQPLPGLPNYTLGLVLQLLDADRNPIGPPVRQTVSTGVIALKSTRILPPGSYIVSIQSTPDSVAGTFQLGLGTKFVDRAGGAFQGGLTVGGNLVAGSSGAAPGYAGFCVAEQQQVTVDTYSSVTYGASGAGSVSLTMIDVNGTQVWNADAQAPAIFTAQSRSLMRFIAGVK